VRLSAFASIEHSLQSALTSYFSRHRIGAEDPATRATMATNSSKLELRARPLVEMLSRRGLHDLSGLSIVDLGCGFGALAVYFAWHGARVVGIDANPKFFDVGVAVSNEHRLDVDLCEGRMQALDLDDESFDVAIANNTLCYLLSDEEHHAALTEARRVLRPGGWMVVRDPNGHHPVDHFTGIPLLPLLRSQTASRLSTRRGRPRPDLRLVSPRAMRRAFERAGMVAVRHEPARPGRLTRLARPLARYSHFTAQRPANPA